MDEYRGADAADAPDALAPSAYGDLREDMIQATRIHYIAQTGSRVKAERLVDKLLGILEKHYAAEEAKARPQEPVFTPTQKNDGDVVI